MGFWFLIQGGIELELGDDAAALALLRRAATYLPASPRGVHRISLARSRPLSEWNICTIMVATP